MKVVRFLVLSNYAAIAFFALDYQSLAAFEPSSNQ
jgi:hypothetical protein